MQLDGPLAAYNVIAAVSSPSEQNTLERELSNRLHCDGVFDRRSPERDVAKAQAYFERALSVARAQQAKSWELRAAMSMAHATSGFAKL
jgi:hypothetical protein